MIEPLLIPVICPSAAADARRIGLVEGVDFIENRPLSAMEDDGVPRPARPDATSDQAAAETRADALIKDFAEGHISRRTAVRVKTAAERAIGGHNLDWSFDHV